MLKRFVSAKLGLLYTVYTSSKLRKSELESFKCDYYFLFELHLKEKNIKLVFAKNKNMEQAVQLNGFVFSVK